VGAKQEIYNLINELADQGKAILMISSELEELLGMSDRVGILHEGLFVGELNRQEFDPKLVIGLASGMTREEFACQS
jgi:ribose transport system ATP-binding protein